MNAATKTFASYIRILLADGDGSDDPEMSIPVQAENWQEAETLIRPLVRIFLQPGDQVRVMPPQRVA